MGIKYKFSMYGILPGDHYRNVRGEEVVVTAIDPEVGEVCYRSLTHPGVKYPSMDSWKFANQVFVKVED